MGEAQTPNLDQMSPEDMLALVEAAIDRLPGETLSDLIGYIQAKQRSREEEKRNTLLAKWREEAARMGMQIRLEPIGTPSRGRGTGGSKSIAPKFRGPNGETWSGRGIAPKWLTALEATGRNREEFRIA